MNRLFYYLTAMIEAAVVLSFVGLLDAHREHTVIIIVLFLGSLFIGAIGLEEEWELG